MWAFLAGVIQLLFLILNTKVEKDKEERARKDALLKGWDDAVKSGDTATINDMLLKLRMRA